MAFLQIVALFGLFCLTTADVSEIVGQNQYLPPSKGYNYDRPNVPFPSPTRPSTFQVPSSRPTTGYQPPAPSYVPPVTPTRPAPPRPQPTFPSGPGYQPGPSPSGHHGQVLGVGNTGDHGHHDHHEPGMPYDFEYKVKDDFFGNDYSRNEVSDGEIIRGEYRVQLPDGRLQIVKYTADWKNGYNADVSYEGQPSYPVGGSSGNAPYPASGRPSSNYGPPAPGGY